MERANAHAAAGTPHLAQGGSRNGLWAQLCVQFLPGRAQLLADGLRQDRAANVAWRSRGTAAGWAQRHVVQPPPPP